VNHVNYPAKLPFQTLHANNFYLHKSIKNLAIAFGSKKKKNIVSGNDYKPPLPLQRGIFATWLFVSLNL